MSHSARTQWEYCRHGRLQSHCDSMARMHGVMECPEPGEMEVLALGRAVAVHGVLFLSPSLSLWDVC